MSDTAEQQREQLNSGTKEVAESHRFDEASLAALELTDFQRPGIAFDIGLHPGGQRGLIETMGLGDLFRAAVELFALLLGGVGHDVSLDVRTVV